MKIDLPERYLGGLDGLAIDNGDLYIGVAGADPETSPVQVYWDSALTIPATQPLSISAGYVVHSGARADFYISQSSFSYRLRDKFGAQIDYQATADTLETEFAATTGAGLIGFSHAATYAASTIGKRLQNEVWIEDAPYSADATGAASAVSAINAAFIHAALTGKVVRAGPGTFLIDSRVSNPGVPLIGVGDATVFQLHGLDSGFANPYTVPGAGYALDSAALHATALTLTTLGDAANFTADSYAIVTSGDFYDSPALDPQHKGEFVRIKSISGAVLTLYGPLSDTYTTTPKIVPVTLLAGVEYASFQVIGDKTVAVIAGTDADVELRNAFNTRFAFRPRFSNVTVSNLVGAARSWEGCYQHSAAGCYTHDLGCATNSDGTATDGFGGYGYGDIERGLNFGGLFVGLQSDRVRHTVTGGGSFLYTYGRPVGATVAVATAREPKLSGFDGHEIGSNMRYLDCWAFGAMGPGFTVRNDSTIILGGGAVDCLGAAVALYKGSTENAQNCYVGGGFYTRGCNWGTDFDGTDWTTQACFLNQGDSNTIDDVVVDSCYGYLYDTGADSSNPTLRNVRATNINANGVASFAIRLRKTGADQINIDNITLDVSNAKVTDLVRSEANDAGNVPNIHNFRTINGTISGVAFNGFGAGTNHYVNWTGPGYLGFRTTFTLDGANTISLAGVQGEQVQVVKTASETLDSATDRSVEGAVLVVIAGAGGITITNASAGADTFACKGATDATLTASESVTFVNRSTQWVEHGRSF